MDPDCVVLDVDLDTRRNGDWRATDARHGCSPIRDPSRVGLLPDVTEHLAADAQAARVLAGHHPTRRRHNRGADAAKHPRDRRAGSVDAQAWATHAPQAEQERLL